jgi:hypothetical protein
MAIDHYGTMFRKYVSYKKSVTVPLCPLECDMKSPATKPDALGRAVAEAVSRWLPTAAARVQSRVWSCGICGGQIGAGAGFL